MLPFGVTIPDSVPQRSEIPEGLMNYPVFYTDIYGVSQIAGILLVMNFFATTARQNVTFLRK
jgi:hypothetical protein